MTGAGLRNLLAAALLRSMRERDRVTVNALRSALARIANAEAVHIDTVPPARALEEAPVGAGASDAARRELAEDEVHDLVEAEARDREHAAAEAAGAGRPDVGETLLAEAAVLRGYLTGAVRPRAPAQAQLGGGGGGVDPGGVVSDPGGGGGGGETGASPA